MPRRRTIGDNPLDSIRPSTGRTPRAAAADEAAPAPKAAAAALPTVTDARPEESGPATAGSGWHLPRPRLRRIRLVGGDVMPGTTHLTSPQPGEPRTFRLPSGEVVNLKRDVVRIRVESQDSDRRIGALLGWAAVGAFVVGPLGALAGSLYGGRERRSTSLDIQLHDGRHLRAITDPDTATEMRAEIGGDAR